LASRRRPIPAGGAEVGAAALRLGKNQDRRLRSGHPWVFSNEIAAVEGTPEPGAEVLVLDHRDRPVGRGLYNPHSLIAVRLFTRGERPIGPELFRDRLLKAFDLRRRILPVESTYRLVFGEGDFFPGLVVDRYGDFLAAQSLTAGVERRLEEILDLLEELFSPRGIVCRRDSRARANEGLPLLEPLLRGQVPERLDAPYEGFVIECDLLTGQKTGEFLDQRENRKRVAMEARGRRVLDLYCYSGLFSLHCAAAGAASVIGVDRSASALERARHNLERNAPSRAAEFRDEEVEGALEGFERSGDRFGMIILDPPALVKSRKAREEGARKYAEVNAAALRLLEPGGMLATATCSHHVDAPLFLDILRAAARHVHAELRVVEVRGQSRDHPVLLAARETSYLTMVIAERIR
jgi:23S rRNA (cytosine1962-C5)-methyltransferase